MTRHLDVGIMGRTFRFHSFTLSLFVSWGFFGVQLWLFGRGWRCEEGLNGYDVDG